MYFYKLKNLVQAQQLSLSPALRKVLQYLEYIYKTTTSKGMEQSFCRQPHRSPENAQKKYKKKCTLKQNWECLKANSQPVNFISKIFCRIPEVYRLKTSEG